MIFLLCLNTILLIFIFILFLRLRTIYNKFLSQDINYIKTKIDMIDGDDTFIMKEIKKIQYKQQNDYNSLNSILEKQKEKLNRISADINNIKNRGKNG